MFFCSLCGIRSLFLLLPPLASHQPLTKKCHQPTNCHQPIVNHKFSPTNCHQPIATNQVSSTKCHQPIVINQLSCHHLSSTTCHPRIVTTQLSSTDDLLANCLLQGVGCTPWRWLALAGAGGSPPLCRCDLRAWCSKTLCFIGLWKIQNLDSVQTVGFTRVVSVMRTARTCIIRSFWVMGPCQRKWRKVHPKMSQQRPQDRSKMG